VTPDGGIRWLKVLAKSFLGPSGKPERMTGVSLDITERKQAEQEHEQKRNELAYVARISTMNQLASSLAHELNQPLGAIMRNAEAGELFLQDPSPDLDEIRAILTDIRKDNQRAGAVIDRMRSQLKRREVEHNLLDLNLLASEVIGLVCPEADARKVRIALNPVSSLPSVRGDRVQLQQVLLNLLLNAMDAMNDTAPDGRRITVLVQAADTQVEVAVSDAGHGIPADKLSHVFEPFFSTKPNGLGMGLAISRSIIEAHRGSIRAKNNEAAGATFTIILPAAEGGNAK
jgi:two-component system sensor kinase FixL